MKNKTKKITVVGGGSAGWMVASALVRYMPDREITVVDSSKVPPIGVGESTTAMMRTFIISQLGIPEKDFLKGTDAILKMNVRFKDFHKLGEHYDYPIGTPFLDHDLLNSSSIKLGIWSLKKFYYPETPNTDFVKSFFPHYYLYEKNKIGTDSFQVDGFINLHDYAYHLDATKLGPFLKNYYCLPRNVKHIDSEIKNVEVSEDGVEALILEDGTRHEADFFIDCSGFKSLLLGQAMKEEWVSLDHYLVNNRSWASPAKYIDPYLEMRPYTTATALSSGWAWHTPIWSRIGNGYAYCDKFISPEDALKEFKNHLMTGNPVKRTRDQIEEQPFLDFKMKAGYHKRAWVKNVAAVGLASGFLEPLEGTGLMFVHNIILNLVKFIKEEKYNEFSRTIFNHKVEDHYKGWTHVLMMFYITSTRDDSEYWKHVTSSPIDIMFHRELYNVANGIINDLTSDNLKLNDASNYILHGAGFSHDVEESVVDRWKHWELGFDWKPAVDQWITSSKKNIYEWEQASEKEPHVYDYFKEKIWGDK
jgi:tryptophan halogenase